MKIAVVTLFVVLRERDGFEYQKAVSKAFTDESKAQALANNRHRRELIVAQWAAKELSDDCEVVGIDSFRILFNIDVDEE